MDAIRQWLDEQGLAQYAEAFEANDIDVDVLHTLTDQDLQALGVSLGNRRRLLEAFKDTSASASHAAIVEPEKSFPIVEATATSGERRQLTGMFCDLVGSTALTHETIPANDCDSNRSQNSVILLRNHRSLWSGICKPARSS